MICAQSSALDAHGATRHGPEYRAAILQSAAPSEPGTVCIEEAQLAAIRSRFGLPAAPSTDLAPATLPQRVRSLAAALLRWVRNGCPISPARLYLQRRLICARCPYYIAGRLLRFGTCSKCGCIAALKLRLASERCPESRW